MPFYVVKDYITQEDTAILRYLFSFVSHTMVYLDRSCVEWNECTSIKFHFYICLIRIFSNAGQDLVTIYSIFLGSYELKTVTKVFLTNRVTGDITYKWSY